METLQARVGNKLIAKRELILFSNELRKAVAPRGSEGIIVGTSHRKGKKYFNVFWDKLLETGIWSEFCTHDMFFSISNGEIEIK